MIRMSIDGPDQKYSVDTSSLHRETSRWVAEQVAGVRFEEKDGRFGCVGLGVGHTDSEPLSSL